MKRFKPQLLKLVWCCYCFWGALCDDIRVVGADDCSPLNDCISCASSPSCGWCPATATCTSSSSSGTCQSTATNGPFTTQSEYCSTLNPTTNGTLARDCFSCTAEGQLSSYHTYNGWCPVDGACYYGDRSGPVGDTPCNTTAENGTWTFSQEYCGAVNPTSNQTLAKDCSTCTVLGELEGYKTYNGWCPATGKCYFGDTEGPSGPVNCNTTASNGTWTYDSNYCAAVNPASNVSLSSSCDACTAMGELKGYKTYNGWCPVDGKCYFGGVDGPTKGTVCSATAENGSWVYERKYCAGVNPATNLTLSSNCSACTAIGELQFYHQYNGWCPSTGECLYGDSSGPMDSNCNSSARNGTWTTSKSHCAAVNPTQNLKDCRNCTNSRPAESYNGWCPSNNKCFFTSDKTSPYQDADACPHSVLGIFTTDCNCQLAPMANTERKCHACDLDWCWNAQACTGPQSSTRDLAQEGVRLSLRGEYLASVVTDGDGAASDACPGKNCPLSCNCGILSDECISCKSGLTGPATRCVDRCQANCADCRTDDATVCFSSCASGFTAFPDCNSFCPTRFVSTRLPFRCDELNGKRAELRTIHGLLFVMLFVSAPWAQCPVTCIEFVHAAWCAGMKLFCDPPQVPHLRWIREHHHVPRLHEGTNAMHILCGRWRSSTGLHDMSCWPLQGRSRHVQHAVPRRGGSMYTTCVSFVPSYVLRSLARQFVPWSAVMRSIFMSVFICRGPKLVMAVAKLVVTVPIAFR